MLYRPARRRGERGRASRGCEGLLRRIVITTSYVAAGLAAAVDAAGAQEMGPRASAFAIRRMEHRLGLSDAQREHIRAIAKSEQPAIVDLARRLREQNKELDQQAGFNEAQVRAYARAHESTTEDLLVEREKIRSEMLQVLTTEQQAKLEQTHAQRASELVDRMTEIESQFQSSGG